MNGCRKIQEHAISYLDTAEKKFILHIPTHSSACTNTAANILCLVHRAETKTARFSLIYEREWI